MKAGVRQGEVGGVRLVPGLAVRAGQMVAAKYRVEELLGSDATGVTLAARNVLVREPVLLKILASYTDGQTEQLERRLAKARIATRLKSTHVARVLDIGTTEDGMPYLAYEALTGNTLEEELAERGPLPVADATRWVLEACEAVAEAHTLGLVHGDLKPKNIVLAEPKPAPRHQAGGAPRSVRAPEADPRVLKILDFAATSPLEAISDQTNAAFCSSPAYLAPEQIQDPASADARADVWAMGVLLYELLSGSVPFTADTVSGVIVAVVYDTPTLLTDAPYALAKIVARCLEKDPANRPQDLYELSALLAAFAGANGVRLSERVAVALETPPPPSLKSLDVAASGSIAPLSVALRASGIPRAKPAASPRTWQRLAGLVTAAAVLGGVGFGIGRLAIAMKDDPRRAEEPAQAAAVSTTTITSETIAPPVDPAEPTPLPSTADAATDVDPVSFAPSDALPVTPTPLATAEETPPVATAPLTIPVTSLPVAAPLATPPRAAAPLPLSPAARSRLPAGLPTTREQVMLPPAPAPRAASTAARTTASDSTYLRGFLSDRK